MSSTEPEPMPEPRIPLIIYRVGAVIALAGLAEATYLTVLSLTGATAVCGARPIASECSGVAMPESRECLWLGLAPWLISALLVLLPSRPLDTPVPDFSMQSWSGRCSPRRSGFYLSKRFSSTLSAAIVSFLQRSFFFSPPELFWHGRRLSSFRLKRIRHLTSTPPNDASDDCF
jgi:hypothetical protein